MFYLELQHGPSHVGVEQQTVGSYTGARITCVFNRDLNRASIHVRLKTPSVSLLQSEMANTVSALAHTLSTVCFGLLQALSDELSADASTWQLVHKWVHQSHAGCVPPRLCLSATHLRMRDDEHEGLKCHKEWNKRAKRCETSSQCALILMSLGLNHFEPVSSVFKQAPTLSSILTILHFITANHGIRTQITNEIRTLEVFTNNQSHASCWAGGCCLGHNEPIDRHCGILTEWHQFKTTLKVCVTVC